MVAEAQLFGNNVLLKAQAQLNRLFHSSLEVSKVSKAIKMRKSGEKRDFRYSQ